MGGDAGGQNVVPHLENDEDAKCAWCLFGRRHRRFSGEKGRLTQVDHALQLGMKAIRRSSGQDDQRLLGRTTKQLSDLA